MDLLSRSEAPELMDSGALERPELLSALKFLAWSNRFFGGYGAVLERLEDWSKEWPPGTERTVLDVGTGWADLPLELVRWAKSRGFKLRITAIDSTSEVAALARENTAGIPEVEVVEGGVEDFSRQGRKFDYVIGTLVLHHVPRDKQAGFLRLCDAMAARGLLFTDLRRSLSAWLGVTLLTRLFGDRVTRYDGPLSVRRAFRREELGRLAHEAGLPYLEARRSLLFRLSLSGLKDGSSA